MDIYVPFNFLVNIFKENIMDWYTCTVFECKSNEMHIDCMVILSSDYLI